MPLTLTLDAAIATDLGTVRENNEDAGLVSPRLVAVADGMGGHAAGEVASAAAIAALRELLDGATVVDEAALADALGNARDTLRAMTAVDPDLAGMGTTLVAVALDDDGRVLLAHVGDSRVYRLREGRLDQLTVDQTHVQRLVEQGRLDPDQVRHHPFRSIILRSLDDSSDDLPDIWVSQEIALGDRLLLCSDGLSDYLEDAAIARALAGGTPAEAADRLVAAALAARTRDNVTALVADVVQELSDVPTDDGVAHLSESEGAHSADASAAVAHLRQAEAGDAAEASSAVVPATPDRFTRGELLWLGGVVLAFALTALSVWLTGG